MCNVARMLVFDFNVENVEFRFSVLRKSVGIGKFFPVRCFVDWSYEFAKIHVKPQLVVF